MNKKLNLVKTTPIYAVGALLGLFSYASFAQINKGSDFGLLLKAPSECIDGSCESGAYFISNDDGKSLFQLATKIGGPQNITDEGKTNQWSTNRYALLIDSGHYEMPAPFKLGYYTEVLGVSQNTENTIISPGINVLNTSFSSAPGGLNNFWRGLSNLTIDSTNLRNPDGSEAGVLRFAVSQASPIRNMNFLGKDLLLCDWNTPDSGYACGYTSGGFIANSKIEKSMQLGSQQQFYIGNTKAHQGFKAGVWNYVLNNAVGETSGAGDSSSKNPWNKYPFTTIPHPKIINEKPRLIYNKNKQWLVNPGDGSPSINVNEYTILSANQKTPRTNVNVSELNEKIKSSKGLIIMPGVYNLDARSDVPSGKTILGLGIPALMCESNNGCMKSESSNIHIAGIMFDAGSKSSATNSNNTLLTVGNIGEGDNIILQDVYCRVGRSDINMPQVSAYACVKVNANNVTGENLWLWRADHDAVEHLVPWTSDRAQYGLIVNGNNVSMNGLAVEHFQNYQTIWHGKNGQINFYQSELPYLMPNKQNNSYPKVECSIPDAKSKEYKVCASLKITENAKNFKAYGLGIYSFFQSQSIFAEHAIEIGNTQNVEIHHVVNRWLDGMKDSGISSIINDDKLTVDGINTGYALEEYISH